jgi:hypothetical protein
MLYMTPAEVPPHPEQERDQLADVLGSGADPGQPQRRAHIERRLHQQDRHEQQPVPGERLAGPEHDREQHQHRQQQLLELHQHVGQRQAGPREMQRPGPVWISAASRKSLTWIFIQVSRIYRRN